MAKPRLTKKQHALVSELKGLISALRLDPDDIADEADPEARSAYLETAKDQIIRSAVVLSTS